MKEIEKTSSNRGETIVVGITAAIIALFHSVILGTVPFVVALPALAYTDLVACYGEQLEVSLPTEKDESGATLERTILALPIPKTWWFITPSSIEGNQPLHQLPCLKEPIETWGARGGFTPSKTGPERFRLPVEQGQLGLPVEGVYASSINLHFTSVSRAEKLENNRIDLILAEGAQTDDGFIRRKGENTNATDGSWLFPETYLSPTGTRVSMGCASPVCTIDYRLSRNLGIYYRVVIKDNSKVPPWIEIDRYVRETVLSWIRD